MTAAAYFRLRPDGLDLFVRLTPKASVDRLEGVEVTADGRSHLKARVRAVPEKGAANAALERLVARALGLPASSVSVSAGATSRLKVLHVGGDRRVLLQRLNGSAKRPDTRAITLQEL